MSHPFLEHKSQVDTSRWPHSHRWPSTRGGDTTAVPSENAKCNDAEMREKHCDRILVLLRVNVNNLTHKYKADQFSTSRGTGILPVAEKHGQDARATSNIVTQLE